jgi:phosphohistidine phosphatase
MSRARRLCAGRRALLLLAAREGGRVSETTGRILAVLRHAKAEHDPALADADRALTKRGRRDAAACGEWLRAAALVPDLVLCSTSLRTRQTWEQVSAALGPAGERAQVSFESRLYDTTTALLDIVRENPDAAGTVLMVGHNPDSHQLVVDLTGQRDLAFPTTALAVIRLRGSWRGAAPGSGELSKMWTPRGGPDRPAIRS